MEGRLEVWKGDNMNKGETKGMEERIGTEERLEEWRED